MRMTINLCTAGVNIVTETAVKELKKTNSKLEVFLTDGKKLEEVDSLIWAIGRNANTEKLDLDKIGVKTDSAGWIEVGWC
jgi:glutathione reductase (NADPH)